MDIKSSLGVGAGHPRSYGHFHKCEARGIQRPKQENADTICFLEKNQELLGVGNRDQHAHLKARGLICCKLKTIKHYLKVTN